MAKDVNSVVFHITDCVGCEKFKDKHDCEHFKKILSLIKAYRKESETKKYDFRLIKKSKMPFSIQKVLDSNTIHSIHLSEMTVNKCGVTNDLTRICAYVEITYVRKNKTINRICIINDIRKED